MNREAAGRIAVGQALRARRYEAGLTLAALAQASGLSLSYLSDVERGRKLVSLDALDRIAIAHGLLAVDLLKGVYPYGAADEPDALGVPADGRTGEGMLKS